MPQKVAPIQTAPLKEFLRTELLLSASAIDIALHQWEREQGQLPAILWRYGLVTIDQFAKVFQWLDQQPGQGNRRSA